jgi:hypothetical protein
MGDSPRSPVIVRDEDSERWVESMRITPQVEA